MMVRREGVEWYNLKCELVFSHLSVLPHKKIRKQGHYSLILKPLVFQYKFFIKVRKRRLKACWGQYSWYCQAQSWTKFDGDQHCPQLCLLSDHTATREKPLIVQLGPKLNTKPSIHHHLFNFFQVQQELRFGMQAYLRFTK